MRFCGHINYEDVYGKADGWFVSGIQPIEVGYP